MARAHGEGTLFFHPGKGVWVGRWRGREVSARTRADATAKLEALREGSLPKARQTVGDVLDWWTGEYLPQRVAAGRITTRTMEGYAYEVRHLKALRKVRLSDLDASLVDRHLGQLAKAYSPRTVQYVRAVLRMAMRAAAAKKLVPASVAEAVMMSESVEVVPAEVPILTPAMAERVLTALEGDRLRPLYIAMLGLGLRFGEASALSWADVDLEHGTARIRHSLGRVKREWILGRTRGRTSAPTPAPKEDRLELTRATHANLSPIFSLYPDPGGAAPEALAQVTSGEPFGEATDHDGTRNTPLARRRPRRRSPPFRARSPSAELLIADGHHRYETARVYADEIGGEGEHRYVLMLLVALDDPGLLVFPTHRLLTGLKDDTTSSSPSATSLKRDFEVERSATPASSSRPRRRPRRLRLHGQLLQAAGPAHAEGPGDRRRGPRRACPSPTAGSTPRCSRRSSCAARSP